VLWVEIAFKNRETVLGFAAKSFEVERDPFGNKTFSWDTSENEKKLLTLNADEVLYATVSEASQ
jgi:hypothetical protein